MKEESDFQAVINALPDDPLPKIDVSPNIIRDPLKKYVVPGEKISLSELGIRNVKANDGQQIYMEHWDGIEGVIDIEDIILLDPTALAANKGRIKFMLTDEVQASLQVGKLKVLIDLGFFENEGFASYS